jgi:type I restriction enzyme S subunit
MVLRPKSKIDSLFYYQILKSQNVIDELQFLAESRSGTFPQITFDALKHIDFVLPNESEILENYIRSIRMYSEKSVVNSIQIEFLTKQRDVLLPQLISGNLRLKERMMNRENNIDV